MFAYKENNDYVTNHYCTAKISSTHEGLISIYDFGHVCQGYSIVDLRVANEDDMRRFWDYLYSRGYRYNLNTKKLRHVGGR